MRSSSPTRGVRLSLLSLALCALPAACGTGSEIPAPVQQIGTVSGSDMVVGMSEEGGAVTMFVSGGPTSYATASRWFLGELDGSGRLTMETDKWKVAGILTPEGGEGVLIDPVGKSYDFSVHPAKEGSVEGLYGVLDGECRTGVVVADIDGSAGPSVQGTWCDSAGYFAPITPVTPVERHGNTVRVDVDLTSIGRGTRELLAAFVPAR